MLNEVGISSFSSSIDGRDDTTSDKWPIRDNERKSRLAGIWENRCTILLFHFPKKNWFFLSKWDLGISKFDKIRNFPETYFRHKNQQQQLTKTKQNN